MTPKPEAGPKLELFEVPLNSLVDPEHPDRSKSLGTVASREEAQTLIGHLPGSGGAFLWDHESQRVVEVMNFENRKRRPN
jgi:hypothetical protein